MRVAGDLAEVEACRAHLLDRRARLTFETPAGKRRIHGIVDEVGVGATLTGGRVVLRLRIVPRLDALRHACRSRVFQHMTTRAVAEKVVGPAVAHRFELAAELPARAYTCQYRETDLAFLHRILAEDGLFFWFDRAGDGETWVVADEALAYTDIVGDPRLVVAPPNADSAMRLDEHHVTRVRSRTAASPEHAFRGGRDAGRHGDTTDLASVETPRDTKRLAGPVIHVGHRGSAEDARPLIAPAVRLLESVRRDRVRTRGETVCRRVEAGRRARIDGDTFEADIVFDDVRHTMRAPESGQLATYTCVFEAGPADTPLRPPPEARDRPRRPRWPRWWRLRKRRPRRTSSGA